jgi:hypothetical protein
MTSDQDLALVRILLEERIHEHKQWWQQARAAHLAEILEGVATAPNPGARLIENLIEETQGDFVVAYSVGGLLLDNMEIVKCAIAGGVKH